MTLKDKLFIFNLNAMFKSIYNSFNKSLSEVRHNITRNTLLFSNSLKMSSLYPLKTLICNTESITKQIITIQIVTTQLNVWLNTGPTSIIMSFGWIRPSSSTRLPGMIVWTRMLRIGVSFPPTIAIPSSAMPSGRKSSIVCLTQSG